MALQTYTTIPFTSSGGTFAVDVKQVDNVILIPNTSPITMANNVQINFSGTAAEGDYVLVGWGAGITIGANTFTINGVSMTANQMLKEGSIKFYYSNGTWGDMYSPDLRLSSVLSGSVLIAGTVGINKLESGTPAQIIVVNNGGIPTLVGVTGVIGITDLGVTSITAGSIVNADIAALAAIARTKLAVGTAAHVLINDPYTGAMSSEAQLATSRGGFGTSVAAATGFAVFNSGTSSIGAMSCREPLHISFEAEAQGLYKITFPYACTVTNIQVDVETVLAGTDAGEVLVQNDSSTAMTGSNLSAGVLEVAMGSTTGSSVSSTLVTNNVFTAGQTMRITTSKTTAGGTANVQVTAERTALS